MGNRAIVLPKYSNIGVYLHWNGGPESVGAFLEYCKLRGFRSFGGSSMDGYGLARFVQVVGNFFGGGLSLGIEHCEPTEEDAEGLDNGIYVVDGWDIVQRIGGCDYSDGYDRKEMLQAIDEAQPVGEQLGKDFLNAEVIPISELKLGDEVYILKFDDKIVKHKVVGFAPQGTIKGSRDVSGEPYVDFFEPPFGYAENINNYVSTYAINGMIRRVRKEE